MALRQQIARHGRHKHAADAAVAAPVSARTVRGSLPRRAATAHAARPPEPKPTIAPFCSASRTRHPSPASRATSPRAAADRERPGPRRVPGPHRPRAKPRHAHAQCHRHRAGVARRNPMSAARALAMNARISAGSFTPRSRSTPDDTSTAVAPVIRIASATLSTVSPPARIHGAGARQPRSSDQSNRTALPPGRVASGGGLASTSSRSAPPASAGRSARRATPTGRQTGRPKRARSAGKVQRCRRAAGCPAGTVSSVAAIASGVGSRTARRAAARRANAPTIRPRCAGVT